MIKIDSEHRFKQWYYDRLEPWVHYVPVKADFSDFEEQVLRVLTDDTLARTFGQSGRAVARSVDFFTELRSSVDRFIVWAAGSAGGVIERSSVATPSHEISRHATASTASYFSAMRNVIFIVGMGRSGSSAMARVLSFCGAALPLDILPENYGNPTGYWEPERALQINDRFLSRHASSWYDVEPTMQVQPIATRERAEFVLELTEFLAHGFHEGETAVLKEPRISGLLPYWLAAAGARGLRVSLIHMFRHPYEVAASLDARDGLPAEHAHALWLKYNLFAERDGRRIPRTFLSYESLLKNWEDAVERCVRNLDLIASIRITPAARAAVRDFLRLELRHHASSTSPLPDPASESRLRRTYDLLHDAALGRVRPADFNALRIGYVSSRTAS